MSPHFDDVCFSLGGLTARRRAGILVTLCSLSAFAEQRGNLPTDPAQRTEFVSALRRDEDDRFAAHCGLTPVRLGLQEATLRGHSPFDTPRAQEVSPLFARTIAAALEPPEGMAVRPWLFCPAGIGGHVDHVALRMAVLANRAALARRYRIAFYEDLPYAWRLSRRLRGVAQLQANAGGRRLRRYAIAIDDEQKLPLLRLYASQFDRIPSDLRKFTPALPLSSGAHEAIWTSEAL